MITLRSALALGTAGVFALALPAHGHDDGHAQHAARTMKPEQTPFGIAGNPKQVTRTIDVDMTDEMRFHPALVDVRAGETIRFRIRNTGQTLHELVLGTMDELRQHAATMREAAGMDHGAPYVAHVKPGGTGEIVWTFNRPGEFNFACLIPGHFEAGMIGKAIVRTRG